MDDFFLMATKVVTPEELTNLISSLTTGLTTEICLLLKKPDN